MSKEVPYILQLHDAKKAGKHFDLRIKSPNKDTLYSFVFKSDEFVNCKSKKKNDKKMYFIRTYNHSIDMLKNKSDKMKIPEGKYGAGTLYTVERGNAKVLEWSPKKIVFESDGNILKGKYILVKIFGRLYWKPNGTSTEIWLLTCGR